MVDIRPFKALKYDISKIENISDVLAPPYDIISQFQDEELKKSSSYNFSFLTLPLPDGVINKYDNAKIMLDNWISNGILIFDEKPCFYLIEEIFSADGDLKSFFGLIGLLKIEEYGKGKVLRHEKTLPKPKEDRLNLLSACRANLEFIYTLYDDSGNKISDILNKSSKLKPLIETEVNYDNSLKFRLWVINDEKDIKEIVGLMKSKTILIADGHHRYETSRIYNESIRGSRTPSDDNYNPEGYILSFFVSGSQDNILIHPTHRLINFENNLDPEDFLKKTERYFTAEPIIDPSPAKIRDKLIATHSTSQKKLAACFDYRTCFILTLKDSIENIYAGMKIKDEDFDADFEYLDVNILHKLILENIFKEYSVKDIKYVHTIEEALNGISSPYNIENKIKSYEAGFILNAPSIETVEKLSASGQIMPQKSTYFYPKPCSGLIMYKMDK
jgi:uncharacterized protein (DUF1015 family)